MSETGMSVQARERRAEYYRRWRKEHPEKTKEYLSRYWERKSRQRQELNMIEAPNGETETGNGD